MTIFRLFASGFFIIFIFSLSVFSQTQPTQTTNKIVIVDTASFFDDKTGITKIIAAKKQLDIEVTPKRNELQQLITRTQSLEKDIQNLQANIEKKIPIDEKAAQAKVDELERLRREGKFKEEEYNKFVQRRQTEIVGPPFAEAMRALETYIKSKGYGIVFDASKDQNGFLIFATEQYEITKDFIAFYNARPATPGAPK
jgi:Skp family chaperone for outer membrane proteins